MAKSSYTMFLLLLHLVFESALFQILHTDVEDSSEETSFLALETERDSGFSQCLWMMICELSSSTRLYLCGNLWV